MINNAQEKQWIRVSNKRQKKVGPALKPRRCLAHTLPSSFSLGPGRLLPLLLPTVQPASLLPFPHFPHLSKTCAMHMISSPPPLYLLFFFLILQPRSQTRTEYPPNLEALSSINPAYFLIKRAWAYHMRVKRSPPPLPSLSSPSSHGQFQPRKTQKKKTGATTVRFSSLPIPTMASLSLLIHSIRYSLINHHQWDGFRQLLGGN